MKVYWQHQLADKGAPHGIYFEQGARRLGEALAHTRVRQNGVLTLPDLFEAVQLLETGGQAWLDFAYEMHRSGDPQIVASEAEINAARADGSGGFKGILGELQNAVACLSDPLVRESVSPPYDLVFDDLCREGRPVQFYLKCPVEMIPVWAPILRANFTGAMLAKTRAPGVRHFRPGFSGTRIVSLRTINDLAFARG